MANNILTKRRCFFLAFFSVIYSPMFLSSFKKFIAFYNSKQYQRLSNDQTSHFSNGEKAESGNFMRTQNYTGHTHCSQNIV